MRTPDDRLFTGPTAARMGAAVGALTGALHAIIAVAVMAWLYRGQILPPPYISHGILFDPASRLLGLVLGLPGNFLQRFCGPGLATKLPLAAELLVVNVILGTLMGLVLGASIGR